MLNAKWLYTALTRAKRKIVVVGQRYRFEKTCKSLVTSKRSTVLQNLLLQLLQE
jgi:ATP-dependent exoDNAse (exonuclease V) alpha subunit